MPDEDIKANVKQINYRKRSPRAAVEVISLADLETDYRCSTRLSFPFIRTVSTAAGRTYLRS